ncbi:hypothetical protein SH2C18_35330 [Clostridium sediminicola]|uniref:hypothetical protein n=1 Tax=Clostridium sediminicola TaxID=3114879 RepID=UPI0031F1D28A
MNLNYKEFVSRVKEEFNNNIKSIPSEWKVSKKLADKITEDGSMNDFYGSTSVIKLSEEDRNKCIALRDELYKNNNDMLVRLHSKTFHLTIHAFCNVYNVSKDKKEIKRKMDSIEGDIKELFAQFNREYGKKTIRLKVLGPSTSGSDVVSIKFIPDSEKDHNILYDLFNRCEKLFPLNKPFTPHVSLGYFKLKKYTKDEIQRLYYDIKKVSDNSGFYIELPVGDLAYQHHYHMNDFRDVFMVKDC